MRDIFVAAALSLAIGVLGSNFYPKIQFMIKHHSRDSLLEKVLQIENQAQDHELPSHQLVNFAMQIVAEKNKLLNLNLFGAAASEAFIAKHQKSLDDFDKEILEVRKLKFQRLSDYELYEYLKFLESESSIKVGQGTSEGREAYLQKFRQGRIEVTQMIEQELAH